MRQRRFTWIAAPMLPWALHFVAVYGVQGLACARGWPEFPVRVGMFAITLLALAAIAWIGVRAWGSASAARSSGEKAFAARIASILSALALVAVAFTATPLLLLAPCE